MIGLQKKEADEFYLKLCVSQHSNVPSMAGALKTLHFGPLTPVKSKSFPTIVPFATILGNLNDPKHPPTTLYGEA